MANTQVVGELKDVNFYTALDPYYYTVDNRPLEDLDYNIRLVAQASDDSAGGGNRAALSSASVGYSMLGFGGTTNNTGDSTNVGYFTDRGMFTSRFEVSGLQLFFEHGFSAIKTDGGIIDGRSYELPALAIHDTIKSFTLTPGAAGQNYLIQGAWRTSTSEDRVPSGTSPVMVFELSAKAAPIGSAPLLDAGNLAVMRVELPAGSVTIDPDKVTYLNFRDLGQTSEILNRAKISYNVHRVNLAAGLSNITLSGSSIDPDKIDSVEVFVQGVNQFDWTYNSNTNTITLEDSLTEAADVRVRQTVIALS